MPAKIATRRSSSCAPRSDVATEIELVDVVDAGDKVVVIMRPAIPRQARTSSPVANVTTFRDGKVVEMVAYPDPEEAIAAARG